MNYSIAGYDHPDVTFAQLHEFAKTALSTTRQTSNIFFLPKTHHSITLDSLQQDLANK